MNSSFINFLNLIYPFLAAIFLLLCLPFIKTTDENKITFSPLGWISFDLHIKSKIVINLLIIILSLALLAFPAFRDYSKFFPSRYDMEVFFDEKGIESTLKDYAKDEIESLNLNDQWREERKEYLNNLTSDISIILGIDSFFIKGHEYIHSEGSTTFFVEKVEGWQKYHIKEAKGNLKHVLDLPKSKQTKTFHSKFELQSTRNNYITATISDIYLTYTKILKPHFKQIASLTPGGDEIIYHHSLIALIKVRFFPISKIGDTIYLVKSKDEITWVPIGYAIYKPFK